MKIKTSISFSSTLFLIFLVLKLTNTINWSWWFITAPLYFFPLIFITLILLLSIITALFGDDI